MSWAEQQVRELMRLGISAEDAQASVGWVLDHVPPDMNRDTWTPVADLLVDQLDHAAVQDARAAWYDQAPARFRRILDAVDEVAGDG